jgi:hypothetical protein
VVPVVLTVAGTTNGYNHFFPTHGDSEFATFSMFIGAGVTGSPSVEFRIDTSEDGNPPWATIEDPQGNEAKWASFAVNSLNYRHITVHRTLCKPMIRPVLVVSAGGGINLPVCVFGVFSEMGRQFAPEYTLMNTYFGSSIYKNIMP